VLKALAKSPADGFASAAQFIEALTGDPAAAAPVLRPRGAGAMARAA
jgi:hypothetical protein